MIKIEADVEKTPEYRQGWLSWFDKKDANPFGKGFDTAACPYPLQSGASDLRTRWMDGWWSAWFVDWLEKFEARFAQQNQARAA